MGDASVVRVFSVIAIVLLIIGCDQRKTAASKEDARAEAYLREIQRAHPGMTDACVARMRRNEAAIGESLNDPDCYEMGPKDGWRGLWNNGWEWSNFCENPAKKCPIASDHGDIWLIFAKGAYRGPELADGVYRVEFWGRRTALPGSFGHEGQYDYLMIADEVFSIKKIPGEKYTNRF